MRDYRPQIFWHNSLYMFFSQFRQWCVPTERRSSPAVQSFEPCCVVYVSLLACLIFCCVVSAHSQQTPVPTVTFTCDFPGSEPDHYVISVSDSGSASYDSDSKLSPESAEGDPFHSDFNLSQAARTRV